MKGGEERVEEIKLGLLRFRREVDVLKESVKNRRVEIEELVETRRQTAKELRLGRSLLDVDSRLEELEDSLRIGMSRATDLHYEESFGLSETEDDSDDEEDSASGVAISKLKSKVQKYIYIKRLVGKIGYSHPFLLKQEERILRIRQTLLLDLRTALGQYKGSSSVNQGKTLNVLALYREMGESEDAVQAIRESKRS